MTQRIVGAGSVRGGTGPVRGVGAPKPPETPEPPPQRSRKKPWIALAIVAVLVLAAGGAAWAGLIPGVTIGTETAAAAEPTPTPGELVEIEPVSLNLADGHYLRIGFSLQLTADAEGISTAAAKDIALDLFSGLTVADVTGETSRPGLKEALLEQLNDRFGGAVIDLYYTDYVTQ